MFYGAEIYAIERSVITQRRDGFALLRGGDGTSAAAADRLHFPRQSLVSKLDGQQARRTGSLRMRASAKCRLSLRFIEHMKDGATDAMSVTVLINEAEAAMSR